MFPFVFAVNRYANYLKVSILALSLSVGFAQCQSPAPSIQKEHSMAIGLQIRKARLERGLSQEDLAKAVGLSQNALSLIEDGMATPMLEKVEAIEQYLGVTFTWSGAN